MYDHMGRETAITTSAPISLINAQADEFRTLFVPQVAQIGGGNPLRNLFKDPSFELGTYTTNWILSTTGTSAVGSVSLAWAATGANSMKVVATHTTNAHVTKVRQLVPVIAGLPYSMSAVVNPTGIVAGGVAFLQVDWYNGGSYLSSSGYPATGGTAVQTISLANQVAPATATIADFGVYYNTAIGTSTYYMDSMLFVQSATLPAYFDGRQVGYVPSGWDGAADNSTSWTLV